MNVSSAESRAAKPADIHELVSPAGSLLDLFRKVAGRARKLPGEIVRWAALGLGSLAATASLAAALCSSVALGGETAPPRPAARRAAAKPNIIYIMADDLGYGDVGCYGQKKILTPRLDKMAAEGVRFTQFYTPAPVCAPARRSLLTGMHGGHSTRRANNPIATMKAGEVTVAEVLKQAGYATAIVGKWAEGIGKSSGAPRKQGFDYWCGVPQERGHGYHHWRLWKNGKMTTGKENPGQYEAHCTNMYTDEAIGFIKRNKKKPFFLYLPYQAPHFKYEVPKADMKVYADKPWDKKQKAFAALVTMMDRNIGRILDTLKELELDKNTVVMFTSDNGPSFTTSYKFWGSCGRFQGIKRSLHEGGIRVPMIVRWPGTIAPGTTCESPFAGYDFLATAADLAEVKQPPATDGVSFLPSLLGREQKGHDYLYWESHERNTLVAVRMGKWKLIRDKRKTKWGPYLFDLEKDPGESKNLAKSNPKVVKKLLAIMRKEHTPSAVKKWQLPAAWLKD